MRSNCGTSPTWPTPPPSEIPSTTTTARSPSGVWSLLKRSIANFAAADVPGLVRIIKRKLKKIQYRPHLINGCLAATGLTIEAW